MRPVILITCSGLRTDTAGQEAVGESSGSPGPTAPCHADTSAARRGCLKLAYLQAVERAGAAPLLLPNSPDPENARSAVSAADGLLLSGGWDVNPRLYGQARHRSVVHVDDARDATELSAIRAAMARRIPILAICRGIQMLNVALGGSLVQDIAAWAGSGAAAGRQRLAHEGAGHDIEIDSGSVLAGMWGRRIAVNSRHHQALDNLAEGLKVTARAPDGIVEAAESSDGYPLLAVECHPEDLWQVNPAFLKPFQWLTDAARGPKASQ